MGCGMYFVAVTEEQYDEINEDFECYQDIIDGVDGDDICGLDWEFDAVNFLLTDDRNVFFYDGINSPCYTDACWIDEIDASCLDVDEVKGLAEYIKEFTKSDLKRRFLSDEFKKALISEGEDKIYKGGEFADEEYFKVVSSSVEYLSAFVIRKAEQNKAIFIYYV